MSSIEMVSDDPVAELVADRADVFRTARALCDAHEWDESVSVFDVLQVARFLLETGVPIELEDVE